MIKATLETRNFTFEAYGKDKAEALTVLMAGWSVHARQYGCQENFEPFQEDVNYQTVNLGWCYRDGSCLK